MFATIRRYESDPASIEEDIRRLRAGFVPIISGAPGFVAYHVVNEGEGVMATISLFETRDRAEASNAMAADWIAQNAASLLPTPPQITSGEVVVQSVKPGALVGSGPVLHEVLP